MAAAAPPDAMTLNNALYAASGGVLASFLFRAHAARFAATDRGGVPGPDRRGVAPERGQIWFFVLSELVATSEKEEKWI
jgi:hypothetical protein